VTLTCGIDIGGTKIAGAVVDEQGEVLAEQRIDSPATDPEAIEETVAGLVQKLAEDHEITAVGVGAAGFVDAARSTVVFAPNVAWRDEPLRSELEKRLDLPVVVENDANAAAWGEFAFGAAHDVDDMLMVTVGTGIGGGIVADGELFRGAFGAAAEVGHVRVVPQGRVCGCGNRGCLEQYSSGTALVRDTRAQLDRPEAADLLERAGGDPGAVSGRMITEAAQDGDEFARERLADLGRWLGEGVASLVAVLDPAAVVIGGGVVQAGELLLEPTRDAFVAELTGRGHRPLAEVRPARFGNRAGVIGAADLARR
jgi:glucokinase